MLEWFSIGVVLALAISGIALARQQRRFQRELDAQAAHLAIVAEEARRGAEDAERADGEVVRAHIRLDTQLKIIEHLCREIGWSDDRLRTQLLPLPVPPNALPSRPPKK